MTQQTRATVAIDRPQLQLPAFKQTLCTILQTVQGAYCAPCSNWNDATSRGVVPVVAIAVQVWRVEARYGGMVRKFLSCGIDDEGDKLVFCEFKG